MTRAVILAAGEGTRLRPLTADKPKALVPLSGVPLLSRQLAVLRRAGLDDISVVVGYRADALAGLGLRLFRNPMYASTNMVASLRCARELFDGADDVVVAYGDIVYEPRVLAALLVAPGPLAVVVDLGWHRLWSLRMEDPLADAETLKLDSAGCIVELGRKPRSLDDIQGQYIGLFKVARSHAPSFFERYDALAPGSLFDGRPRETMYMTSYLQDQIDHGIVAHAALVTNGWLEVDSVEDLDRYEAAAARGDLVSVYDAEA